MRGLRLFIRPIEATDRPDLEAFLAANAEGSEVPAWGLLGKLLGELVAVIALEADGNAIRISHAVVAERLRRKWIGRAMLREVEQLAKKMDYRTLVVDDPREAREFFTRVGFEREGDRWVRSV